MKPIAIALTALVATTAIAPMASAGVDFDQLRRENLEKDAVNFDELREENRNKVDFDSTTKTAILTSWPREHKDEVQVRA
jgi:hypothetical protein